MSRRVRAMAGTLRTITGEEQDCMQRNENHQTGRCNHHLWTCRKIEYEPKMKPTVNPTPVPISAPILSKGMIYMHQLVLVSQVEHPT
jgi:hypothetical protein